MDDRKTILRRGARSGLASTWLLAKTILPIAAAITLLQHTPVLPALAIWLSPLLAGFGLSVGGTLALATGLALNLYGAVGALSSVHLSAAESFTVAAMLSFCHGLPLELAVARKVGVRARGMLAARLGLALAAGAASRLLLGAPPAPPALAAGPAAPFAIADVLRAIVTGAATTLGELAAVVLPLMLLLEWLQTRGLLERAARRLRPALAPLGLSERAAVPLLAGLGFGLVYGAGVILAVTREQPLGARERFRLMLFLGLAHSIAEDALLFVPFGVSPVRLALLRVTAAFAVTALFAARDRRDGADPAQPLPTEPRCARRS